MCGVRLTASRNSCGATDFPSSPGVRPAHPVFGGLGWRSTVIAMSKNVNMWIVIVVGVLAVGLLLGALRLG